MLSDIPRTKLVAILALDGLRVASDPKLCEAFLRDYCGEYRVEIAALTAAVRWGIPKSLNEPGMVPMAALRATLARRLQENHGLAEESAFWAVDAWAFALGHASGGPMVDESKGNTPADTTVRIPRARDTEVNPMDGLTYVWIPPGTFQMGCSQGDSEAYDDEKPAHQVTIARGFWMGQTPVTQEAWQRVMGNNPSCLKGPKRPAENINWNDAKSYCEAVGMRLLTEAEWEYAARAGSTGSRYGDLDAIAWYNENSGRKTHQVGRTQANGWGLYDMLGNVWEWVADFYDAYAPGSANDPRGPATGTWRTMRGGSSGNNDSLVRTSSRNGNDPTHCDRDVGFRCAVN